MQCNCYTQANVGGTSFFEKLSRGFSCFYGANDMCDEVPTLAVIYILAYAGTTVFSVLLIRYAEGAVFTVVVLALVTPIVTLFWMFFESLPEIHFAPKFDLAMVFVLLGLVVMMPAVIMYAYLSNGSWSGIETQNEDDEQNKKPHSVPAVPKLRPPPARRTRTLSSSAAIPEVPEKPHTLMKKSASTGKLPRIRSTSIMTFWYWIS